MRQTFCKSCGKPIQWWVTSRAKNIAVDPDPHPEGTLWLFSQTGIARPVDLQADDPDGNLARRPKYRCHFDTCDRPWMRQGKL